MRRSPFYAYPNLPHSFYPSPAQAPYHRPYHPSPPSPPHAPSTRSVINVPVFDSTPPRRSSSPPPSQPSTSPPTPPSVSLLDPSSAATTIQSHFRGFCVRRHRPLLHLRSIAKARHQLQELQSELERPEFPLKVRTSENERLRFSESVMTIILRLDAIEGSMAEVRSQRKEVTKMAIKLQDALDAIVMQKDEIATLNPTADVGGMAPDEGFVLLEQSQEHLCPEANMVQGEAYTRSDEGTLGVSTMQEKSTPPVGDVTEKYMSNLHKGDAMDTVVKDLWLLPSKDESAGQQREVGSCGFEMIPQVQLAETMYDAEQDFSHVTGECAVRDATQRAEEEVNKAIDALHLHAHKNDMDGDASVANQDTDVDDMITTSHGCVESESTDHISMDIVQQKNEGCSQEVELCPGTPTAEEKCDYPPYTNVVCQSQIQGPSTTFERLTDTSDSNGSSRDGYECSNYEAHENRSNSFNEAQAQASTLSIAGTRTSHDNAVLQQLSEDCRQVKSLVGKLLLQNKAQSDILCALSERLELLEHQQQLSCQGNTQKMREKRKLKKGSKRSVKCRNWE